MPAQTIAGTSARVLPMMPARQAELPGAHSLPRQTGSRESGACPSLNSDFWQSFKASAVTLSCVALFAASLMRRLVIAQCEKSGLPPIDSWVTAEVAADHGAIEFGRMSFVGDPPAAHDDDAICQLDQFVEVFAH